MNGVILAVILVGGVGLFIGLFLGLASMKFHVEVDEREEKVLEALPGNNCGGCGFPGCSGLAHAIVSLEAPVNQCPVGGDNVAKNIAEIMGVSSEESEKLVAFVACSGNCDNAKTDYEYTGEKNCKVMAFVPAGGPKSCNYGCMGYGSCQKACMFDAIHIVDGIAVVDKDKCKACGKCVSACPKNLISLIPYSSEYVVSCSSLDKGPDAMKKCTVACIGCGLCKKNCPSDAITVENNNAVIDQSKCTKCGTCIEKCPKKAIVKL